MKTVEITREINKELTRLGEARETKNTAEREEKASKKAVLDAVGRDPVQLSYAGNLVGMISQGIWTGVDQDKLKEKFPKAYTACLVSKPYPKVELAA